MGGWSWGSVVPYSGQQVLTHAPLVIITIRTRALIGARPHKGAHGQYGRGMTTEPLSFPRRYARTQRFTLGAPRAFTVSPDGSRVVFLRSPSGTDRANQLWVLDVAGGQERVAADPGALLKGAGERLSAAERARRERSREGGAGVVGYATDSAVELASFALSGRLFTAELRAGTARELRVPGPVIDPRPSPDGRLVAYVSKGALRVVGAEGEDDRALAQRDPGTDPASVTYGLAEFIAAEEMNRSRGFWWSPESDRLLVARVDDAPVRRWWISDPAQPEHAPQQVAYPSAGTDNADVRLFVIALDGTRTEVAWNRAQYPYLAHVHWSAAGAPLILVQARDQRSQLFLAVDPDTGTTRMVHADEDRQWLDLFPGVPCWSPGGQLVRIADEGGARVLAFGERLLTGPQLHVRAVLDVSDDDVLVAASAGGAAASPETGEVHVYRVNELGVERLSQEPGVHSAVRSGRVTVLVSAVPGEPGTQVQVLREGKRAAVVTSYAEHPGLSPRVTLTEGGARKIPCALLMPTDYDGESPLPVLMDPYGGPHGPRVLAAHNAHLTSQWFADQGFAVVVADGRGTPAAPRPGRRRSGTTSPSPSTTRSTRCTDWPRGIRWTCPGWRSAAGRSAAGSRGSPYCAARTSSTRASRAPRSRTGGCTTPTTRSGTSATRRRRRRRTRRAR